MTFYSIIFGLLFVGACRELLQALFAKNWQKTSLASTVALIIFNDVMYTSHEIEQLNVTYSIQMKFVDLMLFLIMALCIVLIEPAENLLGVKVDIDQMHDRESILWGLLCLYLTLGLVWDSFGEVYKGLPQSEELIPRLLPLPFLGMLLITLRWPAARFTPWFRGAVVMILLLYVFVFKYEIYKKLPQPRPCFVQGTTCPS